MILRESDDALRGTTPTSLANRPHRRAQGSGAKSSIAPATVPSSTTKSRLRTGMWPIGEQLHPPHLGRHRSLRCCRARLLPLSQLGRVKRTEPSEMRSGRVGTHLPSWSATLRSPAERASRVRTQPGVVMWKQPLLVLAALLQSVSGLISPRASSAGAMAMRPRIGTMAERAQGRLV